MRLTLAAWTALLVCACGGAPTRSVRTDNDEPPPLSRKQQAALEDEVVRLLETGELAAAQRAVAKEGASGRARTRLRGLIHHAQGDQERAIAELEQANHDAPGDPRIVLRLAELYCWNERLDEALELVTVLPEQAVRGGPRPWEAMLRAARVWALLNELERAEALLVELSRSEAVPEDVELRLKVQRAELLSWQKRLPEAMALADEVLAEYPAHVPAVLVKGQVLEWMGRYKAALQLYGAALDARPGDAALTSRAQALGWVK